MLNLRNQDRADNLDTRMQFVKMMGDDPANFKSQQKRLISLKRRGRKAELAYERKEITKEQYLIHIGELREFALDLSKTRGWPQLPKAI